MKVTLMICLNQSILPLYQTSLKYNPLAGSSYIRLPKDLDNRRKGLINIQSIDDNECFKGSSVRYLNTADRSPAKITKSDKDFSKKLDFKEIKFPVKIRDIHKIEKIESSALVFLVLKIRTNIQFMYQKDIAKKNMLIYY